MNNISNEATFQIRMVGVDRNCKSSFLDCLFPENVQSDQYSTLGIDIRKKSIIIDKTKVNLSFWDCCGQQNYRAFSNSFFKSTHGVIIIYDINCRDSFDSIVNVFNINYWNLLRSDIKIALIGNNYDNTKERKVSAAEAAKYANENELLFREVDSNKKIGVVEVVNDLVKLLLYKKNAEKAKVYNDYNIIVIDKNKKRNKKRNNTCF